MSQIDSLLALDAAAFTNPDSMPGGEAVVYKKVGTGTRNIYVNVDRNPPEEFGPGGNVFRRLMIIDVANNSTTGISANEIDFGLDRIVIAYPKNATPEPHGIVRTLLSQDAGMIRLELA